MNQNVIREGKMAKSKKRGASLPPAAGMLIRIALVLVSTAVFAVVSVLIACAVIYATDDPGAHVDVGAYFALALTAMACGAFSALFCRESAFPCAVCASGTAVCVMLVIAAVSGNVMPICVSVYAGFMLVSVLLAWLFSRGGRGRRKRKR